MNEFERSAKHILAKIKKRNNECTRKRSHTTYESALKEIIRLKESNSKKLRDSTLHIYYCRYCNGYHIGHNSVVEIK